MVLERLVSGELTPQMPEFERTMADDPELRVQFEELRRTQADLESTALLEEVLAEAGGTAWPEGDELTRRAVAESQTETPGALPSEEAAAPARRGRSSAAGRFPLRAVVAAAAAVAAAIVAIAVFSDPSGPPRDSGAPPTLLGDELPGAFPSGEVTTYTPLRWELALQHSWHYELRVYADTPERAGELLLEVDALTEPTWTPDPEVAATWPDAIVWEVYAVLEGQQESGPYTARAWRSAP